VYLGVCLGIAGALVHLLSYTVPTFNPNFVLYYLFYLLGEVLVMPILGMAVAGAVIVARLAVAEEATHNTRAIVTGLVALMTSGAMAFAISNLVHSGNPWAVGAITGTLGRQRIRHGHLLAHFGGLTVRPKSSLERTDGTVLFRNNSSATSGYCFVAMPITPRAFPAYNCSGN
jgi:MFS family permease